MCVEIKFLFISCLLLFWYFGTNLAKEWYELSTLNRTLREIIMKKTTATFTSLSVALALVAMSPAALAKNEKQIDRQIAQGDIQHLSLDAGVGSVKLLQSHDGKFHVSVTVMEKEGWSLFSSDPQEAELVVTQRAQKLSLSLNDGDYGEEWRIAVPDLTKLSVDLGVGEATIKGISADIDLDVGVGQASIKGAAAAFEKANVESGVGEATIKARGGRAEDNRAMVSDEAKWWGEGQHQISVEVGVGDASVRLE